MKAYYLYIVLMRTNTALSRLIHHITHDKYTHSSIALDKELKNMYSFGRKYTYNPFMGTFKHEQIDKGLYLIHKILPGLIIEIAVSEDQYNKVQTLINDFIFNDNYYTYNYSGLIYGLLNKEFCYNNRFLCSEFVYFILNAVEILDFHVPRNLVRPQHFLNSINNYHGKVIFEGNLKDYPLALIKTKCR